MAIHRYFFHNGEIKESSQPDLYAGQLGLLSGWGIFSTLRVVEGSLFAWERHWARMSRDAHLLNVPMPADPAQLQHELATLVERNQAPDCTLRLVVVRNSGGMWEGPSTGRSSDVIALTADSKHWGSNVRLGIQPHARYAQSDFTRAKVLSWAHNLRWAERAQEQGLDEVILLNEFGRVTECTSANIFASFGSEVITPPVSEGCLPGVTREVVVEELQVPGVKVVERPLTVDELHAASEVFITSTTRGLLPVSEIDKRKTAGQTAVCSRLVAAFDSYVSSDIARRKREMAGRLVKA
jgi:branched-chain amino acid aminotransferase